MRDRDLLIHHPLLQPEHFFGERIPSQAEFLLILFHGYGAPGNNLHEIAQALAHRFPKGLIWSPPGLDPWDGCTFEENSQARQWFSLSTIPRNPMDGRYSVRGIHRLWPWVHRAGERLVPLVHHVMDHYQPKNSKILFGGFSQGSMLALHMGLFVLPSYALLSWSGSIIPPEKGSILSSPHVLLLHGTQDSVLPLDFFQYALKTLGSYNLKVHEAVIPDLDHTISWDTLEKSMDFLKAIL
jgi:phospholipase/carboxylesterase